MNIHIGPNFQEASANSPFCKLSSWPQTEEKVLKNVLLKQIKLPEQAECEKSLLRRDLHKCNFYLGTGNTGILLQLEVGSFKCSPPKDNYLQSQAFKKPNQPKNRFAGTKQALPLL